MNRITLHTTGRQTDILIGRQLLEKLSQEYPDAILLVDEKVYRHHGAKLKGQRYLIIPSGESSKRISFLEEVLRKLIDFEVDRGSCIIGIGGGVVTDLAGFVASVYMRGVRFGFVSTTLLGMVDASIGGKNGVNLDGYKNMVGVINQPEFVWCDLDLLETLDKPELIAGFAEVIKYGLIRSEALLEKMEHHAGTGADMRGPELEQIVAECVAIKCAIVEADEREGGERKLLNYGHTVGHAIERITGVLHGEAVAVGMRFATHLSARLGFLNQSDVKRVEGVIHAYGLPLSLDAKTSDLFSNLKKDKKRSGTSIDFILLKAMGEAFIQPVPIDTLKEYLDDLY